MECRGRQLECRARSLFRQCRALVDDERRREASSRRRHCQAARFASRQARVSTRSCSRTHRATRELLVFGARHRLQGSRIDRCRLVWRSLDGGQERGRRVARRRRHVEPVIVHRLNLLDSINQESIKASSTQMIMNHYVKFIH